MKTIPTFLLFGLAFIFYLAPAQEKDAVAQAKIVKQMKEGVLELNATCISQTPKKLQLRYEMEIEKKGKSGSSKNKQSGEFEMQGKETKTLAVNKFNMNSKDHFDITLHIFQADEVIATDQLTFTIKN